MSYIRSSAVSPTLLSPTTYVARSFPATSSSTPSIPAPEPTSHYRISADPRYSPTISSSIYHTSAPRAALRTPLLSAFLSPRPRSSVPTGVQQALDELAGQQFADRRSTYDCVLRTFVGGATAGPLSTRGTLTRDEQHFRSAVEEKIRVKRGRHNASAVKTWKLCFASAWLTLGQGRSGPVERVLRELVDPSAHNDVVIHLESTAIKLVDRSILHFQLSERLASIPGNSDKLDVQEHQIDHRASHEAAIIRKILRIFSAPGYVNDPATATKVAVLINELSDLGSCTA
ncbi:hypothetical protein K488DRAFT_69978 [Vararia minispora EC-137]|uniref:Uncharacterized protein n=1 Tax=Vararia minispora EC-137 TaxID=1314806 RepID=A0ACB8QND4_9AGAM|nr:hypothetical protein K488DRAFT_69978 [Vararia minispora EC-137]